MKKIIIFGSQPLEKRNFYRYGFDIFVRENWEVIYCNLVYSNFEKDNLEDEKKISLEHFNNIKVYNISKISELRKILDGIKDSFFADFSAYSFLKIYANIKLGKNNIRLDFKTFDIPIPKKNIFFNIINFFKEKNKIHKIIKFFINSLNKFFINFIYKKPILFHTGENKFNHSKFIKIINLHAMDFDFLIKDEIPNKEEKFITFIDQYLENHPDFKTTIKKNVVTKENYFNSLENFFSLLERKLDKKVAIAVHPRAFFSDNRFNNRKKFFFETYNAVKKSKLIIAHTTTATHFICMLKKPVIFIYTNEILKNHYKFVERTKLFANELGTSAINIDNIENLDLNKYLKINESKYNDYFRKYISVDNNKNFLYWEKVIYELKKLKYI